jgi:hypothetical protein
MTKLITYAFFRQETDVSQNVENKNLDNPIKRAQDVLSFVLGKAFFEEIQTQVLAETLTADNDALYDPYIKKFIAWQAYEFYAIRANVYESRSGFRQFSEQNSEIANETIMSNIIKDAKQWTQFYKGEMLTFIKQQKRIDENKYPLYRDCGSRQGNGFHITAVTKKDKSSSKINRRILLNGE